MWYILIRVWLWIIIYIVFMMLLIKDLKKKNKAMKKWMYLVPFFIIASIGFPITTVIPVENFFITFKTPQDVFYYTTGGTITGVVEGKDSCLIIYNKQNTYYKTFALKGNGGYKIYPEPLLNLPQYPTVHVLDEEIVSSTITITNPKNTDDYYVGGMLITTTPDCSLTDSLGSEFQTFVDSSAYNAYKQDDLDYLTADSYTCIENLDVESYYLLSNGEKVTFTDTDSRSFF